jgi:hypothetical protein
MNEEVLQHTHTHTHYSVLYIPGGTIENPSPWIYESDTDPWSLVTQKRPDGHLFYLIISFFLFSRFFRLSPVLKKKKNRRSSAPGGYQGDDKESWEDAGDTKRKSVLFRKNLAHLFLRGVCWSKQQSPLFSCPASKWSTNRNYKGKYTQYTYIILPEILAYHPHTAFPVNLDIYVCVTTTVCWLAVVVVVPC